ncbi:hypothetical protein CRENBAI_013267 [Crenichthys baileyi]|uniref:Uncharacterized protein n=1 Tax=Crenichthys baileyi TaxID=28760 RepID=A0AAV9RBC8_9TELE
MEEIRGTDIKRPPRAREPQETNYPPPPAAVSPQAPPPAVYARADSAMDPETRDPRTHPAPTKAPSPWGPKLIQEREQPKTQPDTKKGTHSHNPTFALLGVQVLIPHRGNQLPDTRGGPLPFGVETNRPHQPAQTSACTARATPAKIPTPTSRPQPPTAPIPI